MKKLLTFALFALTLSAHAQITHQIVSLKDENCHPVPAEYQTARGDEQMFCQTVDGLSLSLVHLGESSYLHLRDSKRDINYELGADDATVFGGSSYVEATAADLTLDKGQVVGLVYRGNGNSGRSRLIAVRLNRQSGKVCQMGIFRTNQQANAAVESGKCK